MKEATDRMLTPPIKSRDAGDRQILLGNAPHKGGRDGFPPWRCLLTVREPEGALNRGE